MHNNLNCGIVLAVLRLLILSDTHDWISNSPESSDVFRPSMRRDNDA